ncbi:hypothetical protein quinque_002717 [Culex quinquefasciatus]
MNRNGVHHHYPCTTPSIDQDHYNLGHSSCSDKDVTSTQVSRIPEYVTKTFTAPAVTSTVCKPNNEYLPQPVNPPPTEYLPQAKDYQLRYNDVYPFGG